jgi:hypothetical protein
VSIHFGGRGFGHLSRRARKAGTTAGYSAEATTYFAGMSVQPDDTRKTALAALIDGLKTDGVWIKLDWLAICAAHDEQAGRVNAITPAQVMTVGSAPTFTTDRGFTGNGSSQYLDSGFNPTTASSPKYVRDSASMGVWCGSNVDAATQSDIGNSQSTIKSRTSSSVRVLPNQSTALTIAMGSATSIGHAAFSRTGASAGSVYKNGASIGTFSNASSALINAPFLVCARNNSTTGTVTPAEYSTRRIQAVHWGQQLSDAETLAMYNRLATYMTAVGA